MRRRKNSRLVLERTHLWSAVRVGLLEVIPRQDPLARVAVDARQHVLRERQVAAGGARCFVVAAG